MAAKRLSDLYLAEFHGLVRAEFSGVPYQYSRDPELQARWELGFREGRELLALGDARTEDDHAITDRN